MRTLLFTLAIIPLLGHIAFAGAQEDLFTAAKQCDIEAAKKALDAGADANAIDAASGQNVIAGAFFCPAVTELLLQKGADPNGGSYPAIINAANNYSDEVLAMLLAAGADANAQGTVDPGAFFRGKINEEKAKGKKANKAMISAWETASATMKKYTVTALKQTVQQTNCVPCLELLIKHGAKINEVDPATNTNILFTLATFGMDRQMRKEGFAKGADAMAAYGINVPKWYGDLPDSKNGTTAEMLSLLLNAGADPNLISSDKNTPLLAALGTQKVEVAKGLVEAGADVTYIHPKNKKDAVAIAAELGDIDLLKMLVNKGADVTLETWDLDKESGSYCKGFTALARAVIFDNYECAKFLIESGCKIKEGISGYFSKPAKSSINGRPIVSLTGSQLYCRYKLKQKTPIYFAIENGNMKMVELLATSFKWYGNHSMEMKAQVGSLDNGSALKGACLAASGKFSPSKYAKALGQDEIKGYLMGLGK